MMNLKNTSRGFAHIIIVLVLFSVTATAVSYGGYKVWETQNRSEDKESSEQVANISDSNLLNLMPVEESLVAATEDGLQASTASSLTTKDYQYDLSTPLGSLNHTVRLVKDGNFSGALFFVSPRFMFKSADALGVDYPVTESDCNSVQLCSFVLALPIDDIEHNYVVIDNTGGPTGGKSARIANLAFDFKGGRVINQWSKYGGYSATIDMYEAGGRWILDRVVFDGYEI